MAKVIKLNDSKGNFHSWAIMCPACQQIHGFDERWSFNGDMVNPTFKPSMLVHENKNYREVSNDKHGHRCHSFVTDGKIKFLGDCTHNMKNQTIELEHFDD